MEEKQRYQRKMEERLATLGRKIDDLLGKAESRAREEYEDLPKHLESTRRKLEELKREGGEAWREMRPGLERAWRELRESFDRAKSRFGDS